MTGLFHTGIIVDDLEQAMSTMGEAFGLEWAPPIQTAGDIHARGGTAFRESLITYSLEGPHHIELIQQLDDTAWKMATGGPRIHHLGFSVEDLSAETARLEGLGYRLEFSGMADDGSRAGMGYLHDPHGGLWVELVDLSLRRQLDTWIRTGVRPNLGQAGREATT
jgi:hypothetical protein